MKVRVRGEGAAFVADVHREDNDEVMYTSDSALDEASAMNLGQKWAQWFDGLSEGTSESIYYILAVPETWPGPINGLHPYSGLHFKIGRARDVRKRVQNLRTGTSAKLIVHALEPGNAAVEAARHRQFESDRRQGEWFASSPPLVKHVFDTWRRHRAMHPDDRAEMAALMKRADILEAIRGTFGAAPDMINPSLNEKWGGNVFVDLVYAHPLWKKRR